MGTFLKIRPKSSNQQPLTQAIILCILVSCFISVASSAKILIFIGLSSHSHRVAIQPLANKLSEIGHEVTFLSPIKPEVKNPKIKEFCPQAMQDLNDQFDTDYGGESVLSRLNDRYFDPFFINFGAFVWGLCYDFHAVTVKSPEFKDWVENSAFDLVITEHTGKEISLGLAHKFGAKVIGFSPSSLMGNIEPDSFGWPTESSWIPEMTLGSRYKVIPDHFAYEFNILTWYLYYKWMYLPRIDSLLKEVFQDDGIPPTETLIKNMNLYLVNIHHSHEFARSLPPFVVPVGGMHITESKKALPKNIQDFIGGKDSEGFIYISFGSIIKASALPERMQKDIFNAIASFKKVKFLLKWEGAFPKDLPGNVLPMKWFPQQDVLAHPKCRGFVSQGGLMSIQQAAHHGVPVIVVPIFGDQPFNAEVAVHHGNGIHLELADINEESFAHSLGQLLYNPAYSTSAKEVSRRFRDRPMTPVDTAVWWTEYVLRHNDTTHLKPLGVNQEWWQRRLLDFWGIVFAGILLVTFVFFKLLFVLIRICKKSDGKSSTKIKKS